MERPTSDVMREHAVLNVGSMKSARGPREHMSGGPVVVAHAGMEGLFVIILHITYNNKTTQLYTI